MREKEGKLSGNLRGREVGWLDLIERARFVLFRGRKISGGEGIVFFFF